MNRVVHFEIHAKDGSKLQKFYQDVFGWEIQQMGSDMGNYRVIYTDKGFPENTPEIAKMGINGGMTDRNSPMPKEGDGVNAYVCIIGVDEIDSIIKKIEDNGGTVSMPKMEVKTVGLLAYYKDPEGNLFGVLQPDLSGMQKPETA